MMTNAQLLSVQVGLPQDYPPGPPDHRPWRSAIDKRPVTGAVWARTLGLDGDGQSNLNVHGGPFRAVNVYPAEHYDFWRATPGLEGMSGGAFGENFTTLGLLETDTCIGDVFRVGEALVEVTQPRGPCENLNRRWHTPDLMRRAIDAVRIGWYLRVLEAGPVQAGDAIQRVRQPYPEFTIARVWLLKTQGGDPDLLRRLVDCPALSDGWRESMKRKMGKEE